MKRMSRVPSTASGLPSATTRKTLIARSKMPRANQMMSAVRIVKSSAQEVFSQIPKNDGKDLVLFDSPGCKRERPSQ